MRSVYSRGLNFHGQCGLGKDVLHSMEKFTEINTKLPINKIKTNLGHTVALDNNQRTVYYWGFNWDTRSFFRTGMVLQTAPRFTELMKKIWPPLKTFPNTPTLLHTFENKIKSFDVGGGHLIFSDDKGNAFTMGENTVGQAGTKDLTPVYTPNKVTFLEKKHFVKVSAGFQHSIFLTEEGEVYGCGKSDKYQLGEEYLKNYNEAKTLKDIGMGVKKINIDINDKIIDVCGGKYHSIFLTDKGDVYCMGVNRFGQLGQSNLNLAITSNPIKLEFEKNVKIVKIKCGDSHNLLLSEDGTLYANGDNSAGEINGNLDNFLYYFCTPQKIILPEENQKIMKIYAKGKRSAVKLENGNFYYWGGYSYHSDYQLNNQPKYEGFNIFNSEPGIPEGSKIQDIALGMFHDCVIVD